MSVGTAIAGLTLLAVAATAQPALAPPRIGCYRDATGRLRPLLGVGGNFLAGEPMAAAVVALACDRGRGLWKAANAVELRDGGAVARWEAPPGTAVLALGREGSASACFPASAECWLLAPGRDPLVFPLDGEPLAVAWPRAVVKRGASFWLVEFAGGERELQAISPPVLLRADGTLLYADGTLLVVRAPSGEERRIPVAVQALEWIAGDWVRVDAGIAVNLESGVVYRLPEVAP